MSTITSAIFKQAEQALIDSPLVSDVNAASVAGAVTAAVAPVAINAANKEPWYQSRIIWTQIVMLVSALLGLFGYAVAPEYKEIIIAAGVAIGGVVGPLYTLYARLKTGLKPLGQ